ncbi:hypothetical protein CRG98_042713 [Punica granatum]|uniref:Uncharacterized protein n=1 Tax=Punica granatum TaxID=22663 RepID=A0A2I0HYY4_PUNGR|nr:hypothetical protein CRG98_042713 [Punica granatum]
MSILPPGMNRPKSVPWGRLAVRLVGAAPVDGGERLTRQPRLEIDNQKRPRNPRIELFQCFPSVMMCSETTAISVCQKRVLKVCREAFVTIETLLERPNCLQVPFICLWSGRPGSPVRKVVVPVTIAAPRWSRWIRIEC